MTKTEEKQNDFDKEQIMIDHLGDDCKDEPVEPPIVDNPKEDVLNEILKGL